MRIAPYSLAIRLAGIVCMALWLTVGCATTETAATSSKPVIPRQTDAAQVAIDAMADGEHAALFWTRAEEVIVLYPIDSSALRSHANRGSRPSKADLQMISDAALSELNDLVGIGNNKAWGLHSVEAVDVTDRADGRRYWLYLVTWQFAGPDVPDIRIPVFPDGTIPTAIQHEKPEGVRL